MIVMVILAGVAYAILFVRYLTQHPQAADVGPGEGRSPAPASTPALPCCACGDLADSNASVWTALDDHQLTRLLKESSS
jgi:hypothetical protein